MEPLIADGIGGEKRPRTRVKNEKVTGGYYVTAVEKKDGCRLSEIVPDNPTV